MFRPLFDEASIDEALPPDDRILDGVNMVMMRGTGSSRASEDP